MTAKSLGQVVPLATLLSLCRGSLGKDMEAVGWEAPNRKVTMLTMAMTPYCLLAAVQNSVSLL